MFLFFSVQTGPWSIKFEGSGAWEIWRIGVGGIHWAGLRAARADCRLIKMVIVFYWLLFFILILSAEGEGSGNFPGDGVEESL